MDPDRFERLTQRQRECLGLVDQRLSAKEIAERLNISPGVVNEHLSAARRLLGVGRSSEAARLLREHEQAIRAPQQAPHSMGVYPIRVPEPAQAATDDWSETSDGSGAGLAVGEAPARYEVAPTPAPESVLRSLDRIVESRRHDLTAIERILLGLLAAFIAVALLGAFVTLQRALV